MVFEAVRAYVQLVSGLSELTRARATELAQGMLSLPAAGVATGGNLAVQVGALAEELLNAAETNRQNLAVLVRSEVDAAVSRLGLVSAEKLEKSQAEAARLRTELARLRSPSSKASTSRSSTDDPSSHDRGARSSRLAGRSPRATVGASAKKAPTSTAPRKTATKAGAKATATKAVKATGAAKTSAAKTSAATTSRGSTTTAGKITTNPRSAEATGPLPAGA